MHTLTLKRVLGFTIVILLLLALFIWGIGLETLKARQVDLLYLGQRHLMLVFTSMFLLYWSVSRVGFYSADLRQKDLLNMSCKSLMLVIPAAAGRSGLSDGDYRDRRYARHCRAISGLPSAYRPQYLCGPLFRSRLTD